MQDVKNHKDWSNIIEALDEIREFLEKALEHQNEGLKTLGDEGRQHYSIAGRAVFDALGRVNLMLLSLKAREEKERKT